MKCYYEIFEVMIWATSEIYYSTSRTSNSCDFDTSRELTPN